MPCFEEQAHREWAKITPLKLPLLPSNQAALQRQLNHKDQAHATEIFGDHAAALCV